MSVISRRLFCGASGLLGLAALLPQDSKAQSSGTFSGNPLVELLPDGWIELKAELEFVTDNGQLWRVPAGYRSNGASIPRAFWSIVGGPLDGPYRDASIIHDYYCEHFTRKWPAEYLCDWRAVHRAFYAGMRARGVSEVLAKSMYGAVYHFGPRWERSGDQVSLLRFHFPWGELASIYVPDQLWIEKTNPSLEEIEQREPQVKSYQPQRWNAITDPPEITSPSR